MEPQILAQTPEWLVLAKPAGWLTIPGRGEPSPVVRDWAAAHLGGPVWVVHRLDRDTSGVLLMARTEAAHRRANEWFSHRKVKKTYDFIAAGRPQAPLFKLSFPVEGTHSVTQVQVQDAFPEAFLGSARPLTGRRHQIRIHLSKSGNPLWGDSLYGGPVQAPLVAQIQRVALHAARLELPSGEVFEAPWPADFESWVLALRRAEKARDSR